jgi:hypothetical protein
MVEDEMVWASVSTLATKAKEDEEHGECEKLWLRERKRK